MTLPSTIVGHLTPDLDCLLAIWILQRFAGAQQAKLAFVPSGQTLDHLPVDSDPQIVHVDTGCGQFDHHQAADHNLCAAELVRRSYAPANEALQRMVDQATRIDHAEVVAHRQAGFSITDLIAGYNAMYPNHGEQVMNAMANNFAAWYEQEQRHLRLERAFEKRIEFKTRWGLGIAMQSGDGGSSRLAYGRGAVLYAYRDRRGYMGVAAQQRSNVDLSKAYEALRQIDGKADWYLHPNRRLLLCGTPKSPPEHLSELSLNELIDLLKSRA